MLYSRFSLDIYFIHSSVCRSIPVSQFIPPPFPLWCPYILLHVWVCISVLQIRSSLYIISFLISSPLLRKCINIPRFTVFLASLSVLKSRKSLTERCPGRSESPPLSCTLPGLPCPVSWASEVSILCPSRAFTAAGRSRTCGRCTLFCLLVLVLPSAPACWHQAGPC